MCDWLASMAMDTSFPSMLCFCNATNSSRPLGKRNSRQGIDRWMDRRFAGTRRPQKPKRRPSEWIESKRRRRRRIVFVFFCGRLRRRMNVSVCTSRLVLHLNERDVPNLSIFFSWSRNTVSLSDCVRLESKKKKKNQVAVAAAVPGRPPTVVSVSVAFVFGRLEWIEFRPRRYARPFLYRSICINNKVRLPSDLEGDDDDDDVDDVDDDIDNRKYRRKTGKRTDWAGTREWKKKM